MTDTRIQPLLLAAMHVIAERDGDENARQERLEAWIDILAKEVQELLGMDRKAFRALIFRTFEDPDHVYPLGKHDPYDNQTIDRRNL